jgi:small multidrug resistance pump
MNHWILLAAAIVLEVVGTSALKLTEQYTRPLPTLIVVASYVGAFFLLGLVLKTIPVGLAYAIWAGAGIVLVCLIGWLAFGQVLDLAALAGIALIVTGVVVINLFSKSVPH